MHARIPFARMRKIYFHKVPLLSPKKHPVGVDRTGVALKSFVAPRIKKLKRTKIMKKQIPISHMNQTLRALKRISLVAALVAIIALTSLSVPAQCPVTELPSGLRTPLGIAQS